MRPPNGFIALPISFERALLHHSAHLLTHAQLHALIGVSIGLEAVIIDAAQLAQLFAAPRNFRSPEEV